MYTSNLNIQTPINQSLLGKLKKVNSGLDENLKLLLNNYQLTIDNCCLLLLLSKQTDGKCTYTQILETEITNQASLAKCMKQLADKGYIKLRANNSTGEKNLQLSARGFKMAEELNGFELLLSDCFAVLNHTEKRQLLSLLSKVQQPVVFSLL